MEPVIITRFLTFAFVKKKIVKGIAARSGRVEGFVKILSKNHIAPLASGRYDSLFAYFIKLRKASNPKRKLRISSLFFKLATTSV